MQALHVRVLRNNVFRWGDRFVAALEETASARGGKVEDSWRLYAQTPVTQRPSLKQ
jgi:hypothetical protein